MFDPDSDDLDDAQPTKTDLIALEMEEEDDPGEVCKPTSMDDPLACLKKAIGPLLSKDEEFDLAARIRQGDQAALDKLVKSNLSLVIQIARRYYEGHLKFSDYVQEGCIGLTIAAKKFDGNRDIRFITYAKWWIRQCIGRAIANQNKTVRSPVRHVERMNRMRSIISRFTTLHGYEPSPAEIAREMECEEKVVLDLLSEMEDALSLNKRLSEDDGTEYADLLVDENGSNPERYIEIKELEDAYDAEFNKLTEKEKQICMLERSARVSSEEKKGMSRQLIHQYRMSIQKKMMRFCEEHLKC
ncbi:sigma-70 family RNA polymerase sigma factor [Geomonas sp. RF6]|uniref:sigma-70 family RNA polymerase sigma factor n=1 Tax=Geomonas sp. RF6 TaxID=2897342 RepID=UPI001E5CFCEF|nr:sigma-70 family RNA polymerase sigma factor [Geomonas sp. RF6]UFS70343.1 sigma-70 family RNA polymerase sigma factor [Geomonas sp. RF6]